MDDKCSEEDLNWIKNVITSCYQERFYGEISVKMQGGKIADVKKVIDLKPPSFYKNKVKNT